MCIDRYTIYKIYYHKTNLISKITIIFIFAYWFLNYMDESFITRAAIYSEKENIFLEIKQIFQNYHNQKMISFRINK